MTDTNRPQLTEGPPPADGRHYMVLDANFNVGSGVMPVRGKNWRYGLTKRGVEAIKAREGKVTP